MRVIRRAEIGIAPARIDILTALTGLELDDAWPNLVMFEVEGHMLPFLSREALIRNKTALARPRDFADTDDLQRG